MHPSIHARTTPDKPALIMAGSGAVITYAQLDEWSLRCAQLLRGLGLNTGDCIAICMDNNRRYFELCWAAQRSGLYYVCISDRLGAADVAYIVKDSGARALFLSVSRRAIADDLAAELARDNVELFSVDGSLPGYRDYESTRLRFPPQRLFDESAGAEMLYTSGTTGKPKGVRAPLSGKSISDPMPLPTLINTLYGMDANSINLTPTPLYVSAAMRICMNIQRAGGTCVVMEQFDPRWALSLIEQHKVTHSEWVPPMFVRLLKLPEEERRRHELSSHRLALHSASRCPLPVKRAMLEWWGPIIHEYYAGSESNAMCAINSEEWLKNEGSVGRAVVGQLHVLDPDGNELPPMREGLIYFERGIEFAYHNDPQRTARSRNEKGWVTLGDIGYLNEDGFLFLTGHSDDVIVASGEVVHPQEIEDLLIMHPAVNDVAVIGSDDSLHGNVLKAVVQLLDPAAPAHEVERQLLAFCRSHLAPYKCPRGVLFAPEVPRHPSGRLNRRQLLERHAG